MRAVRLSDLWQTPPEVAAALGPVALDPCWGPGSPVCPARAYTLSLTAAERAVAEARGIDALATDGLDEVRAPWGTDGLVYVNPPYSRPLPWALRLSVHVGPWAALVKLDPTTAWWRALVGEPERVADVVEYAYRWTRAKAWAPFRARLRFAHPDGRTSTAANFPSALVWGYGWTPPPAMQELLAPFVYLHPESVYATE